MGAVLDIGPLTAELTARRARGHRVVLTNGIFDLMHLGHVRYLRQARALGDLLVVAVNSDASTRQLKGPLRPIVPQGERAEVLAALACVDYVTIFDEVTADRVIAELRPDLYVKGADYAASELGARQRDYVLANAELSQVLAGETGKFPELAGLGERLGEAYVVAENGGGLALLSYLPGHSTTALIARIQSLPRE